MRNQFTKIALLMSLISSVAFAEGVSEELKPEPYPLAILDRPFVMPENIWQFNLGTNFNENLKEVELSAQMQVGLVKNLSLQLDYNPVEFREWDPGKNFALTLKTFLWSQPADNMYLFGSVKIPFSFAAVDRPVGWNGPATVFRDISFGTPFVKIYGKFCIFALAENLVTFSWFDKTLIKDGYRPAFKTTVQLPLVLGYQFTPNLWVDLAMSYGTFEFGQGQSNNKVDWRRFSAGVDVFYAFNNAIDIYGSIGNSNFIKDPGSFYFSLGVSYRVGALGG